VVWVVRLYVRLHELLDRICLGESGNGQDSGEKESY
jgi:hypothetical protein